MTNVRLTLLLYIDAAKDALRAFPRTWLAVVFLIGAGVLMMLGRQALGPTGMIGGIVLSLIECVMIGLYLTLLEIGLVAKRTVSADDITGNVGSLFHRTLSVAFALSIPTLIFSFLSPPLAFVWILGTALALNPAVELIYQGRSDDFLEIFRNALSFNAQNWPEWFGGHVPILLPLGALYAVFSSPTVLALAVWVLQLYSPHYGFFSLGTAAASMLRGGPVGIALALVLLTLNHLVMLYRGALFAKLNRSSRRARAWNARAEGR